MRDGRITVLVEDTAGGRGLLAEHGLSFWIVLGNQRVLFDTGQGHVLLGNARRLDIQLQRVNSIALSHGHYDHTGGLGDVLRNAQATTVYAHPAALEAKYACSPGARSHEIGMSRLDQQAVRDLAELIPVQGPTEIGRGLYLTGPVPRTNDFEDSGGAFFTDQNCTAPDSFIDDQAAYVETNTGTVVLLGCAHAGVINTLRYIHELTKGRRILMVMGGMHLLHADSERLDRTVDELRRLDVERLLPCHCTGFAAMARLWNEFQDRCATCPAGTVVEVPR